jgi:hypothetical protein
MDVESQYDYFGDNAGEARPLGCIQRFPMRFFRSTMKARVRILAVGLVLFMSCARDTSSSDTARIERLVSRWSPYRDLGGPFKALKEWMATSDSAFATRSRKLSQWEAEDHARIDSISDAPSAKPMKDILHSLIRSEYHLEQLDCALSPVAMRLSPSFLTHPTPRGDSLLASACALLHATDSTSVEITAQVQAYNRLSRTTGLSDTLRVERFQVSRRQVVVHYYHFLGPELQAYLLAPD